MQRLGVHRLSRRLFSSKAISSSSSSSSLHHQTLFQRQNLQQLCERGQAPEIFRVLDELIYQKYALKYPSEKTQQEIPVETLHQFGHEYYEFQFLEAKALALLLDQRENTLAYELAQRLLKYPNLNRQSFSSIAIAFERKEAYVELVELYESLMAQTQESNFVPTSATTSSYLRCLNHLDRSEQAIQVLNEYRQRDLPLNIHCLRAGIIASCKVGNFDQAVEYLNEMEFNGWRPFLSDYKFIIQTALDNQHLETALQWHQEVVELNLLSPSYKYTLGKLILTMLEQHQYQQVVELYDELPSAGAKDVCLNAAAVTGIITSCVEINDCDKAFQVYKSYSPLLIAESSESKAKQKAKTRTHQKLVLALLEAFAAAPRRCAFDQVHFLCLQMKEFKFRFHSLEQQQEILSLVMEGFVTSEYELHHEMSFMEYLTTFASFIDVNEDVLQHLQATAEELHYTSLQKQLFSARHPDARAPAETRNLPAQSREERLQRLNHLILTKNGVDLIKVLNDWNDLAGTMEMSSDMGIAIIKLILSKKTTHLNPSPEALRSALFSVLALPTQKNESWKIAEMRAARDGNLHLLPDLVLKSFQADQVLAFDAYKNAIQVLQDADKYPASCKLVDHLLHLHRSTTSDVVFTIKEQQQLMGYKVDAFYQGQDLERLRHEYHKFIAPLTLDQVTEMAKVNPKILDQLAKAFATDTPHDVQTHQQILDFEFHSTP